MSDDLTYINRLLRRFGSYVYDRDKSNMYLMMDMEITELYQHQLISKEEYMKAKLILRRRMNDAE